MSLDGWTRVSCSPGQKILQLVGEMLDCALTNPVAPENQLRHAVSVCAPITLTSLLACVHVCGSLLLCVACNKNITQMEFFVE